MSFIPNDLEFDTEPEVKQGKAEYQSVDEEGNLNPYLVIKLEYYVSAIERDQIDLSPDRETWIQLIQEFASLGLDAEPSFLRVACISDKFDEQENKREFAKAVNQHKGKRNIGSFFFRCHEAGISPYQKVSKKKTAEKDVRENPLEIAIRSVEALKLKRNQITGYLEMENRLVLSEEQLNGLIVDLMKTTSCSQGKLQTLLASNYVPSYHPIREWFTINAHLRPSGNIERLIQTITPQKKGYTDTMFKRWLVGCVATVFEHTCNMLMPILYGPVNTGKSSFFERLLPEGLQAYFAADGLNREKDSEQLMCSRLIILNDELDGLNKKEAKNFRSFVSKTDYTFRPVYGRLNATHRRLASVCGSSNETEFISDPLNNRRLIPLYVQSINFDGYNSIDKIALWIEVYQLYLSGEPWHLSQQEVKLLQEQSKENSMISLERELILKYYDVPKPEQGTFVTFAEIFTRIGRQTRKSITETAVGRAMKELGFEDDKRKVVGEKNKQVRGYWVIDLMPSSSESDEFSMPRQQPAFYHDI